jgi:hypothetical protein
MNAGYAEGIPLKTGRAGRANSATIAGAARKHFKQNIFIRLAIKTSING